jgi:hypothetical protein
LADASVAFVATEGWDEAPDPPPTAVLRIGVPVAAFESEEEAEARVVAAAVPLLDYSVSFMWNTGGGGGLLTLRRWWRRWRW